MKYTRNISSPKARKIVESYTAPPGKSYATTTKTAGVTVPCVDAATQTDPGLITGAPQSSSDNAASTEASADSERGTSETLSQKKKNGKRKKLTESLNKIFAIFPRNLGVVGWFDGTG